MLTDFDDGRASGAFASTMPAAFELGDDAFFELHTSIYPSIRLSNTLHTTAIGSNKYRTRFARCRHENPSP
jgi:hypothetical protein